MLLDCPIEILHVSGYSDTFVYLFASQHHHSTFGKLTPRHLTFNLTHTISYGSNGTHVVIYISVFAKTLSCGIRKANNLIGFSLFRTCMLGVV